MDLRREPGNFTARIRQKPRYIDLSKCTSCGECAKVCPISVPDEYNKSLATRKAAFKQYAQAIPGAFAISKRGTAPCKATCPAHVSVQGFIALINAGQIQGSHWSSSSRSIRFPASAAGSAIIPAKASAPGTRWMSRSAIQFLHRFLADWDLKSGAPFVPKVKESKRESRHRRRRPGGPDRRVLSGH